MIFILLLTFFEFHIDQPIYPPNTIYQDTYKTEEYIEQDNWDIKIEDLKSKPKGGI